VKWDINIIEIIIIQIWIIILDELEFKYEFKYEEYWTILYRIVINP